MKKVFLIISQNSQENTFARVSFLIKLQTSGYNFTKKETLIQVFFYEFCEIFKNTFFYRRHSILNALTFLKPLTSHFSKHRATITAMEKKQPLRNAFENMCFFILLVHVNIFIFVLVLEEQLKMPVKWLFVKCL